MSATNWLLMTPFDVLFFFKFISNLAKIFIMIHVSEMRKPRSQYNYICLCNTLIVTPLFLCLTNSRVCLSARTGFRRNNSVWKHIVRKGWNKFRKSLIWPLGKKPQTRSSFFFSCECIGLPIFLMKTSLFELWRHYTFFKWQYLVLVIPLKRTQVSVNIIFLYVT